MVARLFKRGETSGRADDNAETIRKRIQVFLEKTMPVIEHYEKQDKIKRVSFSSNSCFFIPLSLQGVRFSRKTTWI